MTSPTQGEHAQTEALRLAEILEGDYCPDWFYEQGVDEVSAELRRLHAQVAALTAAPAQPAAPQGVAYAELAECGAIGEQAGAWMTVVHALDVACPGWPRLGQTGEDAAVAAIEKLASNVQAPAGAAPGRAMNESAERKAAHEGYEKRITRISERNPHDEGMYTLGWWDCAWNAAQPTQAQAGFKSGAKSFQTYAEANAYSKGYYAGKKAATKAQAGAVPLTAGWCTHCGEGVTNFCRSKCGDRVCPIGQPRIKGDDHA